jgi:hypothetical protein
MKALLKLKSWQLFISTWCIPFFMCVLLFKMESLYAIYLAMLFVPVAIIFFLIGTLGWTWSIIRCLSHRIPEAVRFKSTIYNMLFFSVTLFFVLIMLKYILIPIGSFDFYLPGKTFLNIGFIIWGMIIWLIRLAAKTIKTIEIGRNAKFNEYAVEFFLILFPFIGVWIIQPRINKLINNSNTIYNKA